MTIAGIFIGGAATRFGGIAKGLLEAPNGGGRVIECLLKLLTEIHATPVFVGPHEDPRYAEIVRIRTIHDRPSAQTLGPLGGLLGLYDHAGDERVLVLACDMPFVTKATLERLMACDAPLAAAKREGRWEPFLSVHDPRIMKPRAEAQAAAGKLSLQALFDSVAEAVEVPIDAHELDDWDSPEDVARTTT